MNRQRYTTPPMGRHKRFKQRKHVSVVLERQEHDDLRLVAAQQHLSLSEYIRKLITKVLKARPAPGGTRPSPFGVAAESGDLPPQGWAQPASPEGPKGIAASAPVRETGDPAPGGAGAGAEPEP